MILDKVDKLKEKLCKIYPEEFSQFHSIRFIYPMGKLQNMQMDRSFESQEIPHGASILLIGDKTFNWDSRAKSRYMIVSEILSIIPFSA
jgi:hypothetical protein